MGYKYCKKRMVFNFVLKDERIDRRLRSRGRELQIQGPKIGKRAKAMHLAFLFLDIWRELRRSED